MLERMCRYDLQQDVLLIIASIAMLIVSDILTFAQEGCQLFCFWTLVNYAYVCTFLLQRSLATDLQNLSMELRKKQSTYLKRLRQQKEVQTKFSS